MLRAKVRKIPNLIVKALAKAWNEFVEPPTSFDPGALTDNTTGTADGTLADVGGAFSQATLNNNFADLAAKYNALRRLFFTSHRAATTKGLLNDDDPTPVVDNITSANGSDLPTTITLANEAKAVINRHYADLVAHDTVASTAIATADATDLATVITLLNAIKASYNTHRTAANVHFENDTFNAITSADASDLGTSQTLANEIKTDFNLHVLRAPMAARLELVNA